MCAFEEGEIRERVEMARDVLGDNANEAVIAMCHDALMGLDVVPCPTSSELPFDGLARCLRIYGCTSSRFVLRDLK